MFFLSILFVLTLGPTNQPKNFEAAQALAKAQNKPLVVYFHASWCAGCKHFDKQLADGDFQDLLEKVVFYTSDCFADEKHSLSSVCDGLPGFPSFQIRQHGKVHEQWLTSDGEMFRKQIEHYLAGSSYVESLKQAFAKTPSIEHGEALAKTYSDLNQYDQAAAIYGDLFKQDPSAKRRKTWLNTIDMQVYTGSYSFEAYVQQLEQFIANYPEEKGGIVWAIDRINWNLPKDLNSKTMSKYRNILSNISKDDLPKGGYPYDMMRTMSLVDAAVAQGDREKGYRLLVDFFGKEHFYIMDFHLKHDYLLDDLSKKLAKQKRETTDAGSLESIAFFERISELKKDPQQGWETYEAHLGNDWQSNAKKLQALVYATRYHVLVDQAFANANRLLDLQPDPDARRGTYKKLMDLAVHYKRWQTLGDLLDRAKQEGVKHSFFDYWARIYGPKIAKSP